MCLFCFDIVQHKILPDMIALRSDLEAHNQRKLVFGLTSNFSVNWQRYFITLGFFTGTDVPEDILLLSVNLSVLDAMRLQSLPCTDVNNHISSQFFFAFSRHLCSYKALLLNDWSTPIIIICRFSLSGCNNHLRMTYCYPNGSMSRVVSITLVNTCDLEHWAAQSLHHVPKIF